MGKYIEFLKNIEDMYEGDMAEVIDEDKNYLYYENNYEDRCMIEKNDEHIYFQYVDEERYLDYISPWDDDIYDYDESEY